MKKTPMINGSPSTSSKRRIGDPLILPNGIGINYETRSGGSSVPYFHSDSGYSSVTDERAKSASVPQYTLEPPTPDALTPHHHRPRNYQRNSDDNMAIQGQNLFLRRLRSDITVDHITLLLNDIGFTAPFNVNCTEDDCTISLEFSHSNVAMAALSLLQHRAVSLFIEASESVALASRAHSGVIDLTRADTGDDADNDRHVSKSSIRVDLDELYGDLGAYDDSGVDTSDSEANAISLDIMQVSSVQCRQKSNQSQDMVLGKTINPPIILGPRVVDDLPDAPRPRDSPSIPILKSFMATSTPLSGNLASPAVKNSKCHSFQVVSLPRAAHNRARRVLLPGNVELPIMTVSMRADFQFFHRTARHRISRYSIPNHGPGHRHIGDAVMIGDIAAVGYRSSPCQVSLIFSREGRAPVITELEHKPHTEYATHVGTKISGVSCLAAKKATANSIHFFTGGYDRSIMLWSVATPDLVVKTERVTTLSTIPHALAFRDRTLASSKKILAVDLAHLSAKPVVAQLCNTIHQIHVHKQAPNVTILETDSLDSQIQIFDERKRHGFDRTPDCAFGVRCKGSKSLKSPCRGDSRLCLFAKGFVDDTVRLWDYRNSKQPVLTEAHQNMGAVMHTVFTESGNIICYNGDSLIFVDSRGETK